MARMRSLKPEFWHDQEITRLPRDVRLMYMAMWNLADEHSRLQGDPRFIKGQAFPYDDDLTAPMIQAMVDALVSAGRVERYTVRGAVYLLLPKLAKHQRLDTDKVPSRHPGPDESDPDPDESGKDADESGKNPDMILPDGLSPANTGPPDQSGKNPDESRSGANKSTLSMEHVAGSREHVARSMLQGGDSAPSPAQTIIGKWLDHCEHRPPKTVVGQVAKHVGNLIAEGIDPTFVERGLAQWASKDLAPTVIPSFVNAAMNPGVNRPSVGTQSAKAMGWMDMPTPAGQPSIEGRTA